MQSNELPLAPALQPCPTPNKTKPKDSNVLLRPSGPPRLSFSPLTAAPCAVHPTSLTALRLLCTSRNQTPMGKYWPWNSGSVEIVSPAYKLAAAKSSPKPSTSAVPSSTLCCRSVSSSLRLLPWYFSLALNLTLQLRPGNASDPSQPSTCSSPGLSSPEAIVIITMNNLGTRARLPESFFEHFQSAHPGSSQFPHRPAIQFYLQPLRTLSCGLCTPSAIWIQASAMSGWDPSNKRS